MDRDQKEEIREWVRMLKNRHPLGWHVGLRDKAIRYVVDLLELVEAQEQRIEELENAVRMADENIGWVTDASADRHVKEVLRKALEVERG